MLPTFLAERGLTKQNCQLQNFPFRDDGLRIWDITNKWVTIYINLNYATDFDVQTDVALKTWAETLVNEKGGKLKGFGEEIGGKLESGLIMTKNYLISALTMVIFTASSMHAAVNFPQRTIMAFAPMVPLAGYKPLTGINFWTSMLPPIQMAMEQLQVLVLLGGVYYSRLGQYRLHTFFRNAHFVEIREAITNFQKNLVDLELTIRRENRTRVYAYTTLLPSMIPQSINI
jgi:arachidonate 15-lipoxygenase